MWWLIVFIQKTYKRWSTSIAFILWHRKSDTINVYKPFPTMKQNEYNQTKNKQLWRYSSLKNCCCAICFMNTDHIYILHTGHTTCNRKFTKVKVWLIKKSKTVSRNAESPHVPFSPPFILLSFALNCSSELTFEPWKKQRHYVEWHTAADYVRNGCCCVANTTQLSNLWSMPNSVSKGFDTAIKRAHQDDSNDAHNLHVSVKSASLYYGLG